MTIWAIYAPFWSVSAPRTSRVKLDSIQVEVGGYSFRIRKSGQQPARPNVPPIGCSSETFKFFHRGCSASQLYQKLRFYECAVEMLFTVDMTHLEAVEVIFECVIDIQDQANLDFDSHVTSQPAYPHCWGIFNPTIILDCSICSKICLHRGHPRRLQKSPRSCQRLGKRHWNSLVPMLASQ
jgi:hypothetical protein